MPVNFDCKECGYRVVTAPKYIGSDIKCPGCNKEITVPNPNALAQDSDIIVREPLPSVDNKSSTDETSESEWYYASGNKQIGPVNRKIMQQLIESGTVTRSTRVWREGMDDWCPASETELSPLFRKQDIPNLGLSTPGKTKSASPWKYIIIGSVATFIILGYIGVKYNENQISKNIPLLVNRNWGTNLVDGRGYGILYGESGIFSASINDGYNLKSFSGRYGIYGVAINHVVDYSDNQEVPVGTNIVYKIISLEQNSLQVKSSAVTFVFTPIDDDQQGARNIYAGPVEHGGYGLR